MVSCPDGDRETATFVEIALPLLGEKPPIYAQKPSSQSATSPKQPIAISAGLTRFRRGGRGGTQYPGGGNPGGGNPGGACSMI